MPAVNGSSSLLETLRIQGLDKDGQPKTSYWKAKIEAEENRLRVLELEALLNGNPVPVVSSLEEAPEEEDSSDLKEQLRKAKKALNDMSRKRDRWRSRAEEAEALLQANFTETVAVPAPSGTSDASKQLIRELQQEIQQRKNAQSRQVERIQQFQQEANTVRDELRVMTRSRDRWREEAQGLAETLKLLRESPAEGNGEVSPLGYFPSVGALLQWMGARVEEGRTLAAGENRTEQIRIEVRGDKLVRVLLLDTREERVYKSVPLDAPATELTSVFLPYQRYYEYRTDPKVLDVCRLLGRPLATM